MTDGQPDYAWSDEQDGIIAIKKGSDKLWIEPYWQAKTGTGINGIGRFYYSTTGYDQYGVFETNPQFDYSSSSIVTESHGLSRAVSLHAARESFAGVGRRLQSQ